MSFADRWLRHPQSTWIRRAIFQIHLWSGIALGLYVAVVCGSGSAVVFREDFFDVFEAWQRTGPTPFQSAVMTFGYKAMRFFAALHGRLLMGPYGETANAIGGFLVSALCLTGLVVWWPGIANWRRGLIVRRGTGWKRLVFDLHSAVGIWTFGFVFMWGMTAGYFVYPQPFRATINYFTPINPPPRPAAQRTAAPRALQPGAPGRGRQRRPLTTGGKILRGFSYAHYGNFAGWPVKALWVLLGLLPAVLFVTSLLMWWNRVLSPALRRSRRQAPDPVRAGVLMEHE
jgi:uncharacterized iron-regulated membrane protein